MLVSLKWKYRFYLWETIFFVPIENDKHYHVVRYLRSLMFVLQTSLRNVSCMKCGVSWCKEESAMTIQIDNITGTSSYTEDCGWKITGMHRFMTSDQYLFNWSDRRGSLIWEFLSSKNDFSKGIERQNSETNVLKCKTWDWMEFMSSTNEFSNIQGIKR